MGVVSADLGPLGNYTGSPFLPDADLMLDTDQDDIGISNEFI